MKIALFAYSRKGCQTAERILDLFAAEETAAWCPARLLEETETADPETQRRKERFQPIPKLFRLFYGERFADADALVFVGACGIAVREIAPFVKSKKTDPAVVCVDDRARFVIPVLSGHIGGANELAETLAEKIGAIPVITTATDINGKFSVDAWAARNGLAIDNMKAAKDVSALILDQDIPILCELPVAGEYPPGTFAYDGPKNGETKPPAIGIYIGWEKNRPFAQTLRLIPKAVCLGIGCRRGTGEEAIRAAVEQTLIEAGIDKRAVCGAASIDLKKDEAGLLAWSEKEEIPVTFYSAEELKTVQGEFTPSAFVSSVTGVDNVCERAAMIGADRLILRKTAQNGVTVAAAVRLRKIAF